jgi:hypothetical protein
MRAEYEPTADQRALVESAAAFGLTQAEIAQQLKIDEKTLRKHFRDELSGGKFKVDMTTLPRRKFQARQQFFAQRSARNLNPLRIIPAGGIVCRSRCPRNKKNHNRNNDRHSLIAASTACALTLSIRRCDTITVAIDEALNILIRKVPDITPLGGRSFGKACHWQPVAST